MADISKCSGTSCPLRKDCYRFTALPDSYRQSYLTKPPYEIVDGKVQCEYFWNNKNR